MLRVRSRVYSRFGEFKGLASALVVLIISKSKWGLGTKNAPAISVGAQLKNFLPTEMRKGFVGLRHLVNFVPFADGVPLPLIGFEDFGRQRNLHRRALLASSPRYH